MSDIGVEEIEAEGQEFDPNLHHAVSHEENDEYGDNQVAEVLQKGYLYRDQVLRHSMVKVVN
jgi:molecular chaperone GrpE